MTAYAYEGVVFKRIATHRRPHLDEIAAIWLMLRFGEGKFPGVSKARIVLWGLGNMTPDGRPAEEHMVEGTLPIGVGGGLFDEHPKEGERREGECAATLVARTLGVAEDPALQKILKYVLDKDSHATAQPFDLAHLVKCLHAANPAKPKLVINLVMQALDAKYHEQREFWTAVGEVQSSGRWFNIVGANGVLKLVVVQSDNLQIGRAARSKEGGGAAVIIQKHQSGNVQIFTDSREKLCLDDLARMVRQAEQRAAGQMITTDWRDLAIEGFLAGWYHHRTGRMLLNGSSTADKIPPTQLALELIRALVKIALSPDMFEPERAATCRSGRCPATRENPCPWYEFGLGRCQELHRRR